MKYILLSSILLLFLAAAGCSDTGSSRTGSHTDTTAAADTVMPEPVEPPLEITWFKYPVTGRKALDSLKEDFGTEGKNIILALNRIDARHMFRTDSLIVPDTILTDFNRYSPFPHQMDELKDVYKIILVSHRIQAFAAYEYGSLLRWGPTSLGKKSTPTPNGLYHTNWKSKKTISTFNEDWILPWAFNLDNFDGVSFHQFDMPGYPASHACARLLEEDAKWIYYWAEQWLLDKSGQVRVAFGTPVIIFGEYAFGKTPPWRKLPEDPHIADITDEELLPVIGGYIDTIKERAAHRDSILAYRRALKDSADAANAKNG